MTDPSTIYSSYNARMLTPEEVAETFVMNDHYRKLLQANHSVLRGPRGTGKTTLLKMLVPRALSAWEDRDQFDVPMRLSFFAVYIPSDVIWAEQLRQLADTPDIGMTLSRAAVTFNVLFSLFGTFKDVLQRYFPTLEPAAYQKLCNQMCGALKLDAFPSLEGLRTHTQISLNQLTSLGLKAKDGVDITLPSYAYVDYFGQVQVACTIFENVILAGETQKWALCFDELEIAPSWLVDDLSNKLRSTDQRFLLKISISPTDPIGKWAVAGAAASGDDYTDIPLWYPTQQEARKFCEDVILKFTQRRYHSNVEPHTLFGSSPFIDDRSYDVDSPFWKLLIRQAASDASLNQLLQDKGIHLQAKHLPSPWDRDTVLRKLKPILVLRDAFRRAGTSAARSRKKPGVYHGVDAIMTISDGNPRWLIGLLNDLLLGVTQPRFIDVRKQEDVLTSAGQRFNALVRSLPHSSETVSARPIRLKDVIDRAAEFFFQRIVRADITLDPPNCFVVDSDIDPQILRLLQKAVNTGALIIVDEATNGSVEKTLRGCTLRLSFMLATQYKQPLRVFGAVLLSRVLDLRRDTETGDLFFNEQDV